MKYAVIGGSVLSQIESLNLQKTIIGDCITTPYGKCSSAFSVCSVAGNEVVYFNRHGIDHKIAPHQVNYRANIYALKQLGITHIIASAAVGGINSAMPPLQCVIPDQLIDYTSGREQTYNDATSIQVKHVDFSYPFDDQLRQKLILAARIKAIPCETRATYGVTQGPRLETVAEIQRMQKQGCDIVGMTIMPEAVLARELGLAYACCAIVVNWAAGKIPNQENTGATISMNGIADCIKDANTILQTLVNTVLNPTDSNSA